MRRGPPPRQLVRLFWLLKENPTLTDLELAVELDVEVPSVKRYKRRLRNSSVLWTNYCPFCFQQAAWKDPNGELVCTRCGVVLSEDPESIHRLPFDQTYVPSCNLAFGRGVGTTLGYNNLYRILAKAHRQRGEERQVPIRQIKVIVETPDHPLTQQMLNYASQLLKRLDLHRDSSHLLADALGRLVRKIGGFQLVSKLDVQPHVLVRCALYLTLKQYMPEKASEAQERFPFSDRYLEIVRKLVELTELEIRD